MFCQYGRYIGFIVRLLQPDSDLTPAAHSDTQWILEYRRQAWLVARLAVPFVICILRPPSLSLHVFIIFFWVAFVLSIFVAVADLLQSHALYCHVDDPDRVCEDWSGLVGDQRPALHDLSFTVW